MNPLEIAGTDLLVFDYDPYGRWREILNKYRSDGLTREARSVLLSMGITNEKLVEAMENFRSEDNDYENTTALITASPDSGITLFLLLLVLLADEKLIPGRIYYFLEREEIQDPDFVRQLPDLLTLFNLDLPKEYLGKLIDLEMYKEAERIIQSDPGEYNESMHSLADALARQWIYNGVTEKLRTFILRLRDLFEEYDITLHPIVDAMIYRLEHSIGEEKRRKIPKEILLEIFHYSPSSVWKDLLEVFQENPKIADPLVELSRILRQDLVSLIDIKNFDAFLERRRLFLRTHSIDEIGKFFLDRVTKFLPYSDAVRSDAILFLIFLTLLSDRNGNTQLIESFLSDIGNFEGTYFYTIYQNLGEFADLFGFRIPSYLFQRVIEGGDWTTAEKMIEEYKISFLGWETIDAIIASWIRHGSSSEFKHFLDVLFAYHEEKENTDKFSLLIQIRKISITAS